MLTMADRDRLRALLDTPLTREPAIDCFLREELDRAEITNGDVPPSLLVTIGSEVKFIDHQTLGVRQVRLAFPEEADDSRVVSVLSPLGSALIGLGPGQSIVWDDRGIERRLTVFEVRASQEERAQASAPRPRP
jgi:regulator of nucleoside diphosphate kinase